MKYLRKLGDTKLRELSDTELRNLRDQSFSKAHQDHTTPLAVKYVLINLYALCDEEIKRREEKDADS